MTAPLFLAPLPALQPHILHYAHTRLGMVNPWTNADMVLPGYPAMIIPMPDERVLIKLDDTPACQGPVIFNEQIRYFKKD